MSVRVRPPGAGIDRPIVTLYLLAVVATAVGGLWLARTAIVGRPDYRTVRVDNRAGLPLRVEAAGPDGGRLALGMAAPRAVSSFHEVADRGASWTFVVGYGGQELLRLPVSGRELAARGWTVQVPDEVTMELERQGYR
jgi:hypothetical protein